MRRPEGPPRQASNPHHDHIYRGPPVVHKYMEMRFARQFVDKGEMRIGTLHDYRSGEELEEAGQVDKFDGVGRSDYTLTGEFDKDTLPTAYHSIFKLNTPPGTPGIIIENCSIASTVNTPNCYIYCTSFPMSQPCQAISAHTDTMVEIIDPKGLARAIGTAFGDVRLRRIAPIDYTGPDLPLYYDRWDAAFRKRPKYYPQQEVRMLWTSPAKSLEPRLIRIKNTKDFIGRVIKFR